MSGMTEVPNKCHEWLHMLFIPVLPLVVSYANWIVWLTLIQDHPFPQRPCMTLSGRGNFPPQLSQSVLCLSPTQHLSSWGNYGFLVSLMFRSLKGRICPWSSVFPGGWAESDTKQTLGECFSKDRKGQVRTCKIQDGGEMPSVSAVSLNVLSYNPMCDNTLEACHIPDLLTNLM